LRRECGTYRTTGQKVTATRQITEAGGDTVGNEHAKVFAPDYIHANKGESGTIEHIDGDGMPTVRFDRTGTATVVGSDEIVGDTYNV
jgi:hypothetical protein